jgi:hypothetical protein
LPLEGTDGGNSTSVVNPDAEVCQLIGPPFDAAALYASLASDGLTDGEADASASDASDSGVADSGD